MRKYNHVGIVSPTLMEGMIYIEPLKVHITDCTKSPNNIEFLYFEPDSPMPELVQTRAHVAYEVPNIQEAIKDAKVLMAPIDMGHMWLAYIEEEGIAIEFNEFK